MKRAAAKASAGKLRADPVTPAAAPVADPYVRAGIIVAVTDGDTVRCELDCGFYLRITTEAMRLFGINAPEHGTPEGDAATRWLRRKLPVKKPVIVRTHKDQTEKYGRLLAEIFIPGQPISVNQQAINAGHAVPWDGHGPRPTYAELLTARISRQVTVPFVAVDYQGIPLK
jgi:endonuclease YncB( thermonuclease family)